jgi:conjugal transfer/entry exclusion protein
MQFEERMSKVMEINATLQMLAYDLDDDALNRFYSIVKDYEAKRKAKVTDLVENTVISYLLEKIGEH